MVVIILGLLNLLKPKKKLTKAQLDAIQRQKKILQDSLKIIQQTDNLETFFSRYKLAEDTINVISQIAGENTPCIANETPKACLESLFAEKEKQTNDCLDRYIRKETVRILSLSRGRKAKAKGIAEIIEVYADQMTEESLNYGQHLAHQLIKKVEAVEGK